MDPNRDRALALAQEAEGKQGVPRAEDVVARARVYLDFLQGTQDAKIIRAAHELREACSQAG